jgi:hypothetical protein
MNQPVITPPPPIPAMARAKMSVSIEGARPHAIVPEPNRVKARSIAPFRPKMSDNRPYKGVKQQTERR